MGKKSGIRFLPFPNLQTAVWWKEPWTWSWKSLEWSSWLCTRRRHCQGRECGPRSVHPVGECPPEPQARPLQRLLCWCSQLPLPAESSPDAPAQIQCPAFSRCPLLAQLHSQSPPRCTFTPLPFALESALCLLPPDHETASSSSAFEAFADGASSAKPAFPCGWDSSHSLRVPSFLFMLLWHLTARTGVSAQTLVKIGKVSEALHPASDSATNSPCGFGK